MTNFRFFMEFLENKTKNEMWASIYLYASLPPFLPPSIYPFIPTEIILPVKTNNFSEKPAVLILQWVCTTQSGMSSWHRTQVCKVTHMCFQTVRAQRDTPAVSPEQQLLNLLTVSSPHPGLRSATVKLSHLLPGHLRVWGGAQPWRGPGTLFSVTTLLLLIGQAWGVIITIIGTSLFIGDLWSRTRTVTLHEQEMTATCLPAHVVAPKRNISSQALPAAFLGGSGAGFQPSGLREEFFFLRCCLNKRSEHLRGVLSATAQKISIMCLLKS